VAQVSPKYQTIKDLAGAMKAEGYVLRNYIYSASTQWEQPVTVEVMTKGTYPNMAMCGYVLVE
jgi:hypothetical protein